MRVVTIDGPAGAGKSTVSRQLAEHLGWRLLDTGAMYRAVALAALRAGVDLTSNAALGTLTENLSVTLPPGHVLLNGEDVTGLIRGVEVTRASSRLAESPIVRQRLVAWQRAFVLEHDAVAEGRDQGTVVFPDALRKFFLTANLEARARRRQAEFAAKGETFSFDAVLADVRERDTRDAERAVAPMKPAEDALLVDTSELDAEQVVALLETEVRDCLAALDTPGAPVVNPGMISSRGEPPLHDRSFAQRVAYDVTRLLAINFITVFGGLRARGRTNLPPTGGVLLVSNHLSYLDVIVIGLPLGRRLELRHAVRHCSFPCWVRSSAFSAGSRSNAKAWALRALRRHSDA